MERTLDLLSGGLPLTGCETRGRLLCFSESQFQFLKQRFTPYLDSLMEDEVPDIKCVSTCRAVSRVYILCLPLFRTGPE